MIQGTADVGKVVTEDELEVCSRSLDFYRPYSSLCTVANHGTRYAHLWTDEPRYAALRILQVRR